MSSSQESLTSERPLPEDEPSPQPRWLKVLKGVLGLAAVGILVYLGREVGAESLDGFARWVEGLGVWGPLAFIGGYAVATVAFIPGSLLTLAAGAIFGLLEGTLWVFLGATLGATAAFLLGRTVARSAVERRIEGSERFERIDRAIGRQGLKIVFLLRLSPVFPFNLLNYALGLTRVRALHYVVACLGMIPGTFLYVYLGSTAGNLASALAGETAEASVGTWIVRGLGLVATIVVTTIVTRIARRALGEEVSDEELPDEEAHHE